MKHKILCTAFCLIFVLTTAIGVRSEELVGSVEARKEAQISSYIWMVETVDSSDVAGWYTSLAINADSQPRISYYEWIAVDQGVLKLASFDGVDWQIETVDSGGDVGGYTSLKLDAENQPHISYIDWINENLKYARYDGVSWQIETVDSDGKVGYQTSLALDANDNPHISYYDWDNEDLKYAYFDGSYWQIETVDSDGDVGWTSSLALDTEGLPHISYYDWTNADLKFARYDGVDWYIETIDSDGSVGKGSSLALNIDGWPHISYGDMTTNYVKYARFDGTEWHIEMIDGSWKACTESSIALDNDGFPHISYRNTINQDLMYACHDGTDWQIEIVDNDGDVGYFNSLVLDVEGWPHISYLDYTNKNLKYAQQQYEPVEANFMGTPTSGLVPLTVEFENLSKGAYETSLWDFGDGETSNLEHPIHEYEMPGIYSVTLTVSGPGGTDTMIRQNYITVYEKVEADFTGTPTSGLAPLIVEFENLSVGDYEICLWDFGDDETSNLEHPIHEYEMPGIYSVTLTVSGPGGTDTMIRQNYITVYEKVEADFTGTPTSGLAPLIVEFENLSVGDYDISLWEFGDGETSNLEDPIHEYEMPGVYSVMLTVSGPAGTDTMIRTNYIKVEALYRLHLPVLLHQMPSGSRD